MMKYLSLCQMSIERETLLAKYTRTANYLINFDTLNIQLLLLLIIFSMVT